MKIVNLGSSFAAGIGIRPMVGPPEACRSGNNYAHLLARSLNCELIDLSVSGATLRNILDTPQSTNSYVFAPQIEGLTEDADVVLVLGGGNDMGYITAMIHDTWMGWFLLGAMGVVTRVRGLLGHNAAGSPHVISEDGILGRYGALLDAIHIKAPKARVIVVEYLTLLSPDTKPGVDVPFGRERIVHHCEVAASLQKATERAVTDRKEWCEIIHSAEFSRGHGLGHEEPWVWGSGIQTLLKGQTWFHPNENGHEAVAEILRARLTESS